MILAEKLALLAEHGPGGWLGHTELVTLEGRCGGHCCRSFILNATPDIVRQRAQDIRDHEARGFDAWPNRDAVFVDEHMEFVGESRFDPYVGRDTFGMRPIWRCRALAENGDCSRYDERPDFCRRHGRDRECYHPQCTLKRTVEIYFYVGPPNIHEELLKSEDGLDFVADGEVAA